MAHVLIRDVPEVVLAGIDAHAARLGLSRAEYIRRRLASDAASSRTAVSVDDLRSFADRFTDLADVEILGESWR
ncbi:MAG: antitoxin [Candidatus Nanopelagicales bacterium]